MIATKTFSVVPVVKHTSYKYVVMIIAIIMMAFQSVVRQTYGLLFSHLLTTASPMKVTWIFNVYQFLGDFTGLFGGPLCDEYGQRLVVFVGGLLFSTGMFVSAFIVTPDELYFSFSIMIGLGMGLYVSVCSIKVPEYFLTQQGLATSLLFSGSALGQLIGPFLVTSIQELVGNIWAIVILAMLFSNVCPLAMLFHKAEEHEVKQTDRKDNIYTISYKHENKDTSIIMPSFKTDNVLPILETTKTESKFNNMRITQVLMNCVINFKIVTSPVFLIISTSLAFTSIAYSNFLMYIPFAMVNNGFTLEDASLSLTVASISMVLGRFVMPAIYDYLPIAAEWYFKFGALLMSISILGFTFVENLHLSYVILLVFGITVGCTSSFRTLLFIELLGIENYPAAYGLNGLQTSLFYLACAAILGTVAQTYDSYIVLIRVIASISLGAFLLWIPMPFAKLYNKKKGFAA